MGQLDLGQNWGGGRDLPFVNKPIFANGRRSFEALQIQPLL